MKDMVGWWRAVASAPWRAVESVRASWPEVAVMFRRPDLHAALWLTVPAVLVGAAFRVALCVMMPCATFLSDTRNFVSSADDFLSEPWKLFGGTTRTFLMAVLYAVPRAMDQPILPWAAAGQHAVGLGMIVLCGLLCRAWFRQWRLLTPVVTLLLAVNPVILYWEHMALPESVFMTLVLAVAVALTLFMRRPGACSFLVVLGTVFLTAGARQEGFLYLGGVFLACLVALRREPRRAARYTAATLVFGLVVTALSSTKQGGQMLITSMIHLAPDRLKSAPDYSDRAVALRERFRPLWPVYPGNHNEARKIIVKDVHDFLVEERGMDKRTEKSANNRFCKKVAMEIATRNAARLPGMAYWKFLATHLEPPAALFESITGELLDGLVFNPNKRKERPFLKRLFGKPYEDREEFRRDLETRYYPGARSVWLNGFQRGWVETFLHKPYDKAPTRKVGPPGFEQDVPELPRIYIWACAGWLLLLATHRERRMELAVWLTTVCFALFVVIIVGSLRARYRLAFEPYIWFGLAALLDTVLVSGKWLWRSLPRPKAGGFRGSA